MSRKARNKSRNKSRINRLRPLAGLLATGLGTAGLAAGQSQEFPKYFTGPQSNGSWVVSDGQVITPAGIQVNLGIRVRAKAVALNPNLKTHTAAVLTLGASEAVEVFDTRTGVVLQDYLALGTDPSGRPPMNQFDLVASPMRTAFAPASFADFTPWTHLANQVPLTEGVTASTAGPTDNVEIKRLRAAWLQKKAQIFAGKLTKPDSDDQNFHNCLGYGSFTRPLRR